MSCSKFLLTSFLCVMVTVSAAPLLAQDAGTHSGKELSTKKPTRPYSPEALLLSGETRQHKVTGFN